jgi:S1-C subfamily serine protease
MLTAPLCVALLAAPQSDAVDWNTVVTKAAPAVVSVRSRIRVPVGRDEAGPFEGSGFVVDARLGLVATNRHVAGEGVVLDLEVRFYDGTSVPATLAFADPLHDFAFLSFDTKLAPAALVAIALDSHTPDIGEEIRMIGNNGGLASTVLSGTISNLDAAWDQDPGVAYYQTSIASAGGSSGSPIIDRSGSVVGMQTAHDDRTSYALPAEYIESALRKLRKGMSPTRGTVGLRLRRAEPAEAVAAGALTADTMKKLVECGVTAIAMIEGVVPDGPAEAIAKAGDVLLSVNGTPSGSLRSVETALDDGVGGDVELEIARNGRIEKHRVSVADMSKDRADRIVLFGGAAFHNITYELRSRADLKKDGVFVAHVEMGSAAEAAELRRDDVIIKIGARAIHDVRDLWNALENVPHGERLVMVVRRPSSFDSATRTVVFVADRIWDPTRFLVRTPSGFIDSPPGSAPDSRPASRPAPRSPAETQPRVIH